jgi:hypothetical protein
MLKRSHAANPCLIEGSNDLQKGRHATAQQHGQRRFGILRQASTVEPIVVIFKIKRYTLLVIFIET